MTKLSGRKIAFIALEPFPNRKGSGARIHMVTSGLSQAGAAVSIFSLPGDDATFAPPSSTQPVAPLGTPGDVLADGVTRHPLKILERNPLDRAIAFSHAVSRALRTFRPDLVIVRGPFEGQAAVDHCHHFDIPLIFEVNGLPSMELPAHHPALQDAPSVLEKIRQLEQRTLDAADIVITQSETTARFLSTLLSTTTPVVIPNGVDPQRFQPRASPKCEGRVVYVGALQPWQGLSTLILAVARARHVAPLTLHVVGPARKAWRKQFERAARKAGVSDAVTFVGAVPRASIPAILDTMDIAVAPLTSGVRNRVQGANPIKLFEYLAAGVPVVASDLACVREVVEEDRAVLVRPGRPKDLAAALVRLHQDQGFAAALADAGRRFVVENATWERRQHAYVVAVARALRSPKRMMAASRTT